MAKAKVKVKERQTEYWTSRAIERFFEDEGYEVTVFPLSGVTEGDLPLDHVFWSPTFSKLFGIQYKALYGNGEDHWPIDRDQLEAIQRIPWAIYSLSEVDDPREWRNALHRQSLVFPRNVAGLLDSSDRLPRSQLTARKYARWGGVVALLESCKFGHKVEDADDLRTQIERLVEGRNAELLQMVDVFVADFEERKVLHLDPMQRPSPVDPQRGDDEQVPDDPDDDRPRFGRNLRRR